MKFENCRILIIFHPIIRFIDNLYCGLNCENLKTDLSGNKSALKIWNIIICGLLLYIRCGFRFHKIHRKYF